MKKAIVFFTLALLLIVLPLTTVFADNSLHLDILIFSTHPDDDQLYLGAVSPIYRQQGKTVGCVFLTHADVDAQHPDKRAKEAKKGRLVSKDTIEPIFGPFKDRFPHDVSSAKKLWEKDEVIVFMVRQIRQYTPCVIVSQDIKGEYGHPCHQIMVEWLQEAFSLSGNPEFDLQSAKEFGVWNPLKLYLHLFKKNQIELDINTSLPLYDGKTAKQVATLGFKCHKSQQSGSHKMGQYPLNKFGLAISLVGYQNTTNNMFEGINLASLLANNPLSAVMKTQEFKGYMDQYKIDPNSGPPFWVYYLYRN